LKKKLAAKTQKPANQPKIITKTEDDYEPVNRWWELEDGALSGKRGAKKWDTFEHHGLMFAPDYEPHNIPIKYAGKEIKLSREAEEIATYWCGVRGSEYEKKELFIRNFMTEFSKVLPKDTVIKDFSKCDFSAISKHLDVQRQMKKDMPREEKERISKEKNKEKEWFSHALVNNIREKLGAVAMEPPQLFRGRGEHPKQGLLKKRTFPEACTINLSECSPVPKVVGLPGHAWKDVVHENTVQWIASFEDGLLGETKYVSFAATSGLKGQPDMLKYDRARRLLGCIDKVRASYEKLQRSNNLVEKQKATATYFIDKLALRVGGEKNTEEEADTVGCCSLRVEHLKLVPPNTIEFDFLGKDSIRYFNAVKVTDVVFNNVEGFMKNKKPEEDVFDKVDPSLLNEYFKEFMDDLTAKVFRTFNASYTLQKELEKFDMSKKGKFTHDELLKFYNDANRSVAILCNHQKAESKTHGAAMEKMQAQRNEIDKQLKVLKKHCQALEKGETPTISTDQKLPKDLLGSKKKYAEIKMRLQKHDYAMAQKEDNKTVSLGTSKMNYMDPRISVAFCKKVDLPIEKVFPRTVRTKFPWAMHFSSTYIFD
jgi:DNA topoisomerase-1